MSLIMLMVARLLQALLSLPIFCGVAGGAAPDELHGISPESVLVLLREQGVSEWAKLKDLHSAVDVVLHSERTPESDPNDVERQETRYISTGQSRLIEVSRTVGPGRSQKVVFCCNDEYGFKIQSRIDGNKTFDWTIDTASNDYLRAGVPQTAIDGLSHGIFQSAWSIPPIGALADVVQSSDFLVQSVSKQNGGENSPEVVEVSFVYQASKQNFAKNIPLALSGKTIPAPPRVRGSIVFIPKWHWAIRKYDIEVVHEDGARPNYRMSTEVAYSLKVHPSGKEVAVPVELKSETSSKIGRGTLSYWVDKWDFVTVDSSRFRLSAFGLPEVAVTHPSIAGSTGWKLVLAANVLLVVAAVFFWLSRRRKSEDKN